jgi:hypothetical protein
VPVASDLALVTMTMIDERFAARWHAMPPAERLRAAIADSDALR